MNHSTMNEATALARQLARASGAWRLAAVAAGAALLAPAPLVLAQGAHPLGRRLAADNRCGGIGDGRHDHSTDGGRGHGERQTTG